MSLTEDIKNEGLTSQVVQKITQLEEYVRKHKAVQHGGSGGSAGSTDGWVVDANTWTFSSADAPVYVVSVNADMTALVSVGMRIRLVHGAATKYFLVHAVGAFGGGVTLLTLYGGTTYTLSATAITSTYYSSAQVPFAFPSNPGSWTVTATDTTNASQAAPTADVWYNVGSVQISAPIGVWKANYSVDLQVVSTLAAVAQLGVRVTLSTANNSASDSGWTNGYLIVTPINVGLAHRLSTNSPMRIITAAAKTTHYLNALSSQTVTSFSYRGDIKATTITLVSAYL